MKARLCAALLAIAALGAAPAFAHAEMTASNIADHASLAKAPDAFTASFEEKATVTGLVLTSDAGKPIALTYTPAKEMSKSLSVPLPKLAAGAYTLSFKVVAKDGHVMMSAIHFTITGG